MINTDQYLDDDIRKIYSWKNIAVVGMSKNPSKAAHYVPKYLLENGYDVIPVNPTSSDILGRKCFASISQIPQAIDVVDIFRPSEDVYPVVVDTIKKKGVKVIWMQEGIYNEGAEKLARENGLQVVYNRCMMAEHLRLFKR